MRSGKFRKSLATFAVLMVPVFVSLNSTAAEHGSGKGSYKRFCADCHGPAGKGDGAKAPAGSKPTDLTQLAKNNGGKYPADKVQDVLEGKTPVAAHGSAEHPVWGVNFNEPASQVGETAARERIGLIVRYLKTIQEK